jgi:hypothetical protein
MGDNPSAFPFQASNDHDALTPEYGMTLRDWFAGQALPAVIRATSAGQHIPKAWQGLGFDEPGCPIEQAMAADAYAIADAMLASRLSKLIEEEK